MAKKKKKTETSAPPSSSAGPLAAAATSDPEAMAIERAFALGNYAQVRALAARASSAEAKETTRRLLPKVVLEREQALVGVVALVVVLVVCALVLR